MASQRELLVAQKEVQSGSIADIGLALGARSSRPVSLARDVQRLESILDTNKTAFIRLDASQAALGTILRVSETLTDALATAKGSNLSAGLAARQAASAVASVVSALNTAVSGEFIFSGLETGTKTIDDAAGVPAAAAMDAAFQGYFGFAKSDAATATISASDFQTFITTQIEPMFMGAGWSGTISGASDALIQSRVTLNDTELTSVSANELPIRRALMAGAISANFLASPFNGNTVDALIDQTLGFAAAAVTGVAQLQGNVGLVQQRIEAANAKVTAQRDLLSSMASDLTSVDPYEAATRLNAILSRIETSYALTQKIQQMSILRYLA